DVHDDRERRATTSVTKVSQPSSRSDMIGQRLAKDRMKRTATLELYQLRQFYASCSQQHSVFVDIVVVFCSFRTLLPDRHYN
ncbi:MAG: hypothetical protein ACREBR_01310, partial [bacterium]